MEESIAVFICQVTSHKRPNSKTMVNRESYQKEAIGNIKIKINKSGELLKLWYGKFWKR
jgi:hypothetical protein